MSAWTPLLASHAGAATTSLLLGGYQLRRRPKGDRIHKLLGRVWVIAMAYVALSSFAIRQIRHGQLSLLHVLSIVILLNLTWSMIAVRRGQIRRHRDTMIGSWLGGLGAGIFAATVPDRLIPTFAVAHPTGAALSMLLIVAITAAIIAAAHWLSRGDTEIDINDTGKIIAISSPRADQGQLHHE